MKKQIFILISLVLMAAMLTGCVSSANKEKMFNLLKKHHCIDVGKRKWDEYDELKQVDHSPIPAVTYYYIFEMSDVKYTISYESQATKKGLECYTARVVEEKDGETEVTVYNFEYKKILPLIWKMKYMGPQ